MTGKGIKGNVWEERGRGQNNEFWEMG